MSKIRYFSNGKYIYFKHCPFCGSVGVDFLGDKFRCPDCGAVVTFDLPKKDIEYLEEPYMAHNLVGVIADNKVSASDNEKVWAKHTKDKI